MNANDHAIQGSDTMAGSMKLRRASEVDAANNPDCALAASVAWIRRFLAKPHPELGRSGPVCPFTPLALELDTIWLIEVPESAPDPQRIDFLARYLAAGGLPTAAVCWRNRRPHRPAIACLKCCR